MNYHQHHHPHHQQPQQQHPQQHGYRRNMDIEAEMSRFENEILSAPNMSNTHGHPSSSSSSSFPVHFIPHQIQRQLPTQRTSMQATFVPTTLTSNSTNHNLNNNSSNSTNNHGHNSNYVSTINNQMSSSGQLINYTVTPMQVPTNVQNIATTSTGQLIPMKSKTKGEKKGNKKKKNLRIAGGQVWEDPTLEEWDPNDFRLFCGDLGNDVSDDVLVRAFNRYPSFVKAKVIRDKRTNKSRGYGFVSFKNPVDFARAMKEMNGKYVGSRPIKLRKSNWQDRNVEVVKKKMKQKQKLGLV